MQLPEKFRIGNTQLLRRFELASAYPSIGDLSIDEHELIYRQMARYKSREEVPAKLRELIEQSELNRLYGK